MTARDSANARKPAQCRQCGEPVPHDREEWATPMCHVCLPPIGAKRAASVLALGRTAMVALLASERPSPHPEGSSAEPAVAVPGGTERKS